MLINTPPATPIHLMKCNPKKNPKCSSILLLFAGCKPAVHSKLSNSD